MFDYHCFPISLEYQSVVNFTASGSNGSMSGKLALSNISQVVNAMRIRIQLN